MFFIQCNVLQDFSEQLFYKTPSGDCYQNITKKYEKITEQKMKFSVKHFFSKCDQIRNFLRIWSHLLNKFLMENFFFCVVNKKNMQCFEAESEKYIAK